MENQKISGSASSLVSEQSSSSIPRAHHSSRSDRSIEMKEQQTSGEVSHPHMNELLALADLAGIKAPEKVMKVLIEMLNHGVSPSDCHRLLRAILLHKKPSHRSSSKHSSKRAHCVPEGPSSSVATTSST